MPTREDVEVYFTLDEFAAERRISKSTVKNLIRDGELAKVYIGPRSPRISASEAKRFDASRETR